MNYDKVKSELVVTRDMQTFLHANRDDVKAFTLFTPNGDFAFYSVPEISDDCFFLLVATGKTCTVYKKITTTIKNADYHTDGIAEFGSKTAEYIDNATYYGMNVLGKSKFSGRFYLTKRSVKEAFGFNQHKLNQYFTQHGKEDFNEGFVRGLANYFNH